MKSQTTMGKLLSTFRSEKFLARQKAEEDLWEKHGLSNPKDEKRKDFQIHESAVHDRDGNTLIILELWKRIDEKRVQIKVNVEAKTIEVKDDIAELMG